MTDEHRKRSASLSKTRYRNLNQYKKMSEEEFDTFWDQMNQGIEISAEYEKRIQHKLASFGEDYDLSDLKVNDLLTLRALAQAFITLEDYESYSYTIRQQGISLDKMIEIEKMSNIMSGLRKDITNMQNDLSITRKVRKGDKEQSVISELERLKTKAKEFYKERMAYIFCPSCNSLLATAWFHYPDSKGNKMQLTCQAIQDNNEICGHKLTISVSELMEKRGVNSDNIPDSLK